MKIHFTNWQFNFDLPSKNFMGVLSRQDEYEVKNGENVVFKIPTLDHLIDGILFQFGNDGNINTLYRVNSFHNTLLATERCNSNCPMCSQPPRDKMIFLFIIKFKKLIPLIPKDCFELGISGGEPTLMGDFFLTFSQIKTELPTLKYTFWQMGVLLLGTICERLGS